MNILILNWKDIKNPDVGGAEIILLEYCRRLIRDKHTITWLSRKFEGCKNEECIDGIHIIRRGGKLSVYLEAYRYYQSLIQKPDIVLDCINTLCFFTPCYVPRGRRIMYVNQLAKEVLFYELPFPLSLISYILEKVEYLPYKDTKAVCYSQSTKNDLISFGIPQKNISVFSLGIDHKRYIPGKKSTDPLFIFVARLVQMKRPLLVLDAMTRVIKSYPKAKLAIIGNGPLERMIIEKITLLGLANHVSLVNKDNLYFNKHGNDQKTLAMQQAWALVIPSVKEGWGMVVTEAAACGTPTIGTNVSGLRDSIIHGKTGILVSKNPSADEVSDAMIQIITNKKRWDDISRNARCYAKQYTWEKSFSEFYQLISSPFQI